MKGAFLRHRGFLVAAILICDAFAALPVEAHEPVAIYSDGLSRGWQNWSFAVAVSFDEALHVHNGKAAIAVTAQPWGCLALNAGDGIDTSELTTLAFWINGGAQGGQTLSVILNGEKGVPRAVNLPPLGKGWNHVEIKLADAGQASGPLKAIWLRNSSSTAADTYYLDDIELH